MTTDREKTFHQVMKRKCSLEIAYNCGLGGTRIARQTKPTAEALFQDLYFRFRAELMPREVDVVVVFGGTNDFGHGDAVMGEVDSHDEYTFYGALNCLMEQLKDDYADSKIVFLTPLKRNNGNGPSEPEGKTLKDYVNAIKHAAEMHNITVIDLYENAPIDPFDETTVPDGLHPNDAGHEILADYLIKALQEI